MRRFIYFMIAAVCAIALAVPVISQTLGPYPPSIPPGGSTTQCQYNNAGALGGITGCTSDGTKVSFSANDLVLAGVTGSTQCLHASTTGVVTGTGSDCGSGGGGSPGGSPTQIQYNDTTFAGSAKFVVDVANGVLVAGVLSGGQYSGGFGVQKNAFANGSPSFGLFNDSSAINTGMQAASSANIDFFNNGNPRMQLSNAFGLILEESQGFSWGTVSGSPPTFTKNTGFAHNAAGVVEVNNGTAGTYREIAARSIVSKGTVPGISGCSAGTQTGGATVGTFASGTTGSCTVVLTFAYTAPTGWFCHANNLTTTSNLNAQTATTTTTATLAGTTVSGDVVNFGCMAY